MMTRSFLQSPAVVAFLMTAISATLKAQVDESQGLEAIRAAHQLPGLSAVMVKEGRIVARGAAGSRRVGNSRRLASTDLVNMDSCTKLVAMKVMPRASAPWSGTGPRPEKP